MTQDYDSVPFPEGKTRNLLGANKDIATTFDANMRKINLI